MSEQKHIGILTLHRALNYGAVLQCWALKKSCEKLNCYVETIDFNPFGMWQYRWFLRKHPINAYRSIFQLYQFNRFIEKRLNLVQTTDSYEFIKNNPPIDDIYIVGSDQVWCDDLVGELIGNYLFDWAPEFVKRISYAASTGGKKIRDCEVVRNELRRFRYISVREESSIESVQQYVDTKVVDVCDPSLLLEASDYIEIEKKKFFLPQNYIVLFNLANDKFTNECAMKLKGRLNYPIINLLGNRQIWCDRNILTATPEQWLYILRHSKYVVTNGFHGTAFAVVFRRPFICCQVKEGGRSKTSGRVENLLKNINLTSRYITDIDQLCDNNIFMDYNDSESSIAQYRKRSLNWLKNAIESC